MHRANRLDNSKVSEQNMHVLLKYNNSQWSLLNPDRRVVLSDLFSVKDVPVFEKCGTRPEQKSISSRRDTLQKQARLSKPPNYSRINSTFKLVWPISQSSMQQVAARSTPSYAAIVKGSSNIKIITTPKSTLKSTSGIQSQGGVEPSCSKEQKVPFKLVPVLPPYKHGVAKSSSIASISSNQIHKDRARIKSKIRSLIVYIVVTGTRREARRVYNQYLEKQTSHSADYLYDQ